MRAPQHLRPMAFKLASGLLAACTAFAGVAQENRKPCSVEQEKKQLATASAGLLSALGSPFKTSQCASLKSVIARLGNKQVSGGRKLENDRPLDVASAEQELQKARADTEFGKVVTAETDGETDPVRRAVIEAAVLDDFGHYKARDLLVARLTSGQIK